MNVTHLECSLTGERYEAGRVHNLSKAGKPLIVRYDMDAARRTMTRESISEREAGMWKWRELLPVRGFGPLDAPRGELVDGRTLARDLGRVRQRLGELGVLRQRLHVQHQHPDGAGLGGTFGHEVPQWWRS